MKKTHFVMTISALLVLATSSAWAVPTINIDESLEGALPKVTFSGFTTQGNPSVSTTNESVFIDGNLVANFINNGKFAEYGIKMLEPAFEGGGVSDFAILTVYDVNVTVPQRFTLSFFSDGATGFERELAAFDFKFPTAKEITETGGLQNLFDFPGLVVNAKSDVIPLPSTVLLLGSGLVGLAAYARRKHRQG
ncbi:MAG: PEP-CTERM sorting domain-containing protein [Desulfobaccales bacterium]